jgi:hypothetical protein
MASQDLNLGPWDCSVGHHSASGVSTACNYILENLRYQNAERLQLLRDVVVERQRRCGPDTASVLQAEQDASS